LFSRFPFLRILIPFVTGISMSPASNLLLLSLFMLCWISVLMLEYLGFSGKWKNRKKSGLLLQLLYFLLGLNCSIGLPDKSELPGKGTLLLVHLQELDKSGENHNSYKSTIYEITKDSSWQKSKCYTYIASSIGQLPTGAVLVTLKHPNLIKPFNNPGSFDFEAYAKRNQIYQTLYINNNNEFEILTYKNDRLSHFLQATRKWIVHTIKAKISDPSEAGLTQALLIGYKDELDKTLQEQYTATGVSHIIAVSGMHLGLIFYVLTLLISLFLSRKMARLIGFSFILPLLWVFAFITGASASVLRSVVVFTILLLGNALQKRSGSINALLASAFFLLTLQPNMITDIGFQLSYAAVLSIIIFEPIVSTWLYVKNKIVAYLWSMIAITIAAQLLTTPIVLFHFKQFPVFFLLTNLIAVPLSSLVLLLAIGVCLLSLINLPTTLPAECIHLCLSGMNSYIGKIASIPFNNISVPISISTVILSYVLIAVLTITYSSKKPSTIIPIVFILLLLGFSHHSYRYTQLSKRQIMVLHLKNETLIVHQHGKTAQLYCSNRLTTDTTKLNRQITQLKQQLGIQYCQLLSFENQPALININQHSSQKAIWVMSALDKPLQQLRQLGRDNLLNSILIADGSNKLWKIRQWEKQAHELHLRLYSTQEKGAFILPCKHE
jgi:competence protein ComEC